MCVALGAFRGAEAGHGVAANGGARQAQPVAGLGRDDQRVGGIEPAGNADDQALRAGRFDPPHQRIDLDVERLVAVLVQLLRPVGDEGEARDAALHIELLPRY